MDSAKFCGGCGSTVGAKAAGEEAGAASAPAPCCVVDDLGFVPETWAAPNEVQAGQPVDGKPAEKAPNPNQTPPGTFLVQLPQGVTPGMVRTDNNFVRTLQVTRISRTAKQFSFGRNRTHRILLFPPYPRMLVPPPQQLWTLDSLSLSSVPSFSASLLKRSESADRMARVLLVVPSFL